MEHKVSIVVPVYGVEKYIGECIESLLAQTYPYLEILLIDDGGKDRSPEICDRYAAQDHRIRVIHKPNGGAASARNAGLDAATGDCICFVDGDDAVHPDYVKHLLTLLTDRDADIAVCGFHNWSKSGAEPVACDDTGEYTGQAYLLRFLRDWSCSLLWNKIYRREVIGDIRMEEGHKVDDEFFTYQVVMNSRKIVVTDTPLYGYRMRGSSVMHDTGSNGQRIMLDRIEYITTRYENVIQKYPDLEPVFFENALDSITYYWHRSYNMPKAQAQIRSWTNQHMRKILKHKMPLKMKLLYLYHLYWRKPKALPVADTEGVDLKEYFD